jgi:microcin C transport system substrate-binding protein
MDPIIDRQRKAETEDEMQKLCWQLQEMVQAKAVSIPAWDSPFYRYAHWRWICFPKDGNVKMSQLPLDSFVFWIDEDKKAETKQAMREGKSFGEVTHIYDQYRE